MRGICWGLIAYLRIAWTGHKKWGQLDVLFRCRTQPWKVLLCFIYNARIRNTCKRAHFLIAFHYRSPYHQQFYFAPASNMASTNSLSADKMTRLPVSPPRRTQLSSYIVPVRAFPEEKAEQVSSEKLVIAIDFGTTFTGYFLFPIFHRLNYTNADFLLLKCRVAYGLTSDPENLTVITEWPGAVVRGRNDVVKIPSVIKYGMSKDDTKPTRFDWGYGVGARDTGVIRGIKLALDPEKRDSYYGKNEDAVHLHEELIAGELARLDKTTINIISDYIGAVYEHALEKIYEMEIGSRINKLTKEFVLTVPAIWTDRAKTATLIVSRPSLACIHLFATLRHLTN